MFKQDPTLLRRRKIHVVYREQQNQMGRLNQKTDPVPCSQLGQKVEPGLHWKNVCSHIIIHEPARLALTCTVGGRRRRGWRTDRRRTDRSRGRSCSGASRGRPGGAAPPDPPSASARCSCAKPRAWPTPSHPTSLSAPRKTPLHDRANTALNRFWSDEYQCRDSCNRANNVPTDSTEPHAHTYQFLSGFLFLLCLLHLLVLVFGRASSFALREASVPGAPQHRLSLPQPSRLPPPPQLLIEILVPAFKIQQSDLWAVSVRERFCVKKREAQSTPIGRVEVSLGAVLPISAQQLAPVLVVATPLVRVEVEPRVKLVLHKLQRFDQPCSGSTKVIR